MDIITILEQVQFIIRQLIPIAFGLAVVFFFWGLAKFILKAGDKEGKEEGRNIMIWGVLALFVMASIWGIVNLLAFTLGVNSGGIQEIPRFERTAPSQQGQ